MKRVQVQRRRQRPGDGDEPDELPEVEPNAVSEAVAKWLEEH